jgi:O-antigen biosynthesis protein
MSRKHKVRQRVACIDKTKEIQASVVDIITPIYGNPEFLRQLSAGMLTVPAGVTWHWYVVDDKGPQSRELDIIYAGLEQDSRCTVIRSKTNRGFAGANNDAFKLGRAPFVLLLNSDIRILHDDWLVPMVKEFDAQNVGVVGARLIYFKDVVGDPDRPAGTVQHAGVGFNLLGQAYHVFRTWDPSHPKVNVRREMNAVTGACLMIRRFLYEKIGGLDEDYTTGNFEDVQACLMAKAHGYKIIYTPNTTLEHYAGGSGNSATAKINEQIFQLKCRGLIEYDDYKYW